MFKTTTRVMRRTAAMSAAVVAFAGLSIIAGATANASASACRMNLVNNGEGISIVEHNACDLGEQGDIAGCENMLQAPPASRPADVASIACVAANNPGA